MGTVLPPVFQRAITAQTLDRVSSVYTGNTLVIVELNGGADGLNIVFPNPANTQASDYTNYLALRPNLSQTAFNGGNVTGTNLPASFPLNSQYSMNGALDGTFNAQGVSNGNGLKKIWNDGNLAVVLGVGYKNPNLSHFASQKIWYNADPTMSPSSSEGWLGSFMDYVEAPPNNEPFAGFGYSSSLPQALYSPLNTAVAVQNAGQYALTSSFGAAADATLRKNVVPTLYSGYPSGLPMGIIVENTAASATTTSATINGAGAYSPAGGVTYPNSGLGNGLKMIAQMITLGLGVRVAYVSTGGWDTHSGEQTGQANLLSGISSAFRAFYDDLTAKSLMGKVALITTSEFGRRAGENGTSMGAYGTDHGAGSVTFVVGGAVNGGIFGSMSLTPNVGVVNGNLKYTTDFGQIYGACIQNWLGADSTAVLGATNANFNTTPLAGLFGPSMVRQIGIPLIRN